MASTKDLWHAQTARAIPNFPRQSKGIQKSKQQGPSLVQVERWHESCKHCYTVYTTKRNKAQVAICGYNNFFSFSF